MSLSRRFLNLIVDDQSGARSLRCINLTRQRLFNPSPPADAGNPKNKQAEAAALVMEQLRLPNPTLSFEAEAVRYLWDIGCFPLADRKVMCADQSGRAFLVDADTRHLVTMPNLHKPKWMPISLFVPSADADCDHGGGGGGSLYIMEKSPNPEVGGCAPLSDQFEAFVDRKTTGTSSFESWHCQLLPPPPFVRDYAYRQRCHEITSYAVVGGGSHICISAEDAGTYCLDTASHTWSEVGKWSLPFCGKVEYVPELKLWFGLSAEAQHLAAADLSDLDSQPQLVGDWKELEPPVEWQESQDSQLVNLGSGRFCIARFFQTWTGKTQWISEYSGYEPIDEEFAVFTGVEVTAGVHEGNCSGSGNVKLGMTTHKSRFHVSNGMDIDAVF